MRRRAMPISWLRRDSQHYRFAMPNSVWEYKLKPIEFLIFSYLCYRPSTSTLTPDVISAGIHMTADTVRKHLAALVRKGIVSEDGTPTLKGEDVKFFTLPNEVFLLRLPPSAFMVYAYLLLIEDRRTHTCHPSYNTIAAATGLAKNTAIKSVNTLLEMHFTNGSFNGWSWRQSADEFSNGKRNTTAVAPEMPCVPRSPLQ